MAVTVPEDVLQDDLALFVARVTATANKQAFASGVDALNSVITIRQMSSEDRAAWRVDYGDQDVLGWRGGGLSVDVAADGETVKRVLRGQ